MRCKGDQPMRKGSRGSVEVEKPAMTGGIDLGDRFSRYCRVNSDGEVMEEGRIATTGEALERHFSGEPKQRMAMECGTHSPWVSRWLRRWGMRWWWRIRASCEPLPIANRRTITTMRRSWHGSRPTMCGCYRQSDIAAWNDSGI